MADLPTLYVCHGDEGGPKVHPCRRGQEAMHEAGVEYEKVMLADGRAAIGVDGQTIDVAAEPEHDQVLNGRISDAFVAKYGESSPGPTEAMVSPEIVGTTLRLTSAS